MRVGIFADVHDHVDNMRLAVATFNRVSCDFVIFAGDFVSPLVVPPLRKLSCRMAACFGDNDGNRIGIEGGMRVIGSVAEPPFGVRLRDGTRVLVTHQIESVRKHLGDADVIIWAHTHKPAIAKDRQGRMFINPGETSGWIFRRPTIAILDTESRTAELIDLPAPGPAPVVESF